MLDSRFKHEYIYMPRWAIEIRAFSSGSAQQLRMERGGGKEETLRTFRVYLEHFYSVCFPTLTIETSSPATHFLSRVFAFWGIQVDKRLNMMPTFSYVVRESERAVGSYVVVNKMYVHRSFSSSPHPLLARDVA